jgi:hypothetical protein
MEKRARIVAAAALVALAAASAAQAGGDWNTAGIAWMDYDAGLTAAKSSGRPICLVFFTEGCPHCTTYSKVFHDAAVVERAKSFVMIRLDRDRSAALSAKYAPDGNYIPRTYFLSPDGTLHPDLKAPRDEFKYFYDESNPQSLLQGMQRALAKLAPGQPSAPKSGAASK